MPAPTCHGQGSDDPCLETDSALVALAISAIALAPWPRPSPYGHAPASAPRRKRGRAGSRPACIASSRRRLRRTTAWRSLANVGRARRRLGGRVTWACATRQGPGHRRSTEPARASRRLCTWAAWGILVKVNTSQFHSSAPVHAPAIWILWQRGVPGGDMLELWLYCMPCGSLAGTRRHSLHGPPRQASREKRPGWLKPPGTAATCMANGQR